MDVQDCHEEMYMTGNKYCQLLLFLFICSSLAVIDHDDIGKDDPLGGISIPLYEVIPGIGVHLRKLLNDPSKVSWLYTENGQCLWL